MLSVEQSVEISVLHCQGRSIRSIARELGLSRNTVRQYLRNPASTRCYGPRTAKLCKLDPYKPYLLERIQAAKPHWIPATVLLREIKALGYEGGISMLRYWLARQKPKTESSKLIRFETEPGQQMQADFMTFSREGIKIKVFVAQLGFSRAGFAWFCSRERQEDWIEGLKRAFDYFGGIPKQVLFDNAKCIMIERHAYGENQHKWNPKLNELAKEYGFQPKACRPYRAQTKGKVERLNRYLKESFITPLAVDLKQMGLLPDPALFNGKVGAWLCEVAHQRIHATTGKTPQALLDQERHHLAPLPEGQRFVKPSTVDNHTDRLIPTESLQHPLSVYDQWLGVA